MIHTPCKHDQVTCPRCGIVYECKVGSINLCQCTAVQLTENQRQYVRSLFNSCLCAKCLLILRLEYTVNHGSFTFVLTDENKQPTRIF